MSLNSNRNATKSCTQNGRDGEVFSFGSMFIDAIVVFPHHIGTSRNSHLTSRRSAG